MSYRIILSPDAHADLRSAIRWYKQEQIDLSLRFKARIQATLHGIVQRPLAFRLMEDGKRRALMRRFPYYIYFTFDGSTVVVTAIVHQRRGNYKS